MTETPTISVLLPVHNAKAFLDAAVGSILMQTLGHIEIIAIDQGSSDGSLELLEQYAKMDARVRVLSRPGVTLAAALNEGAAAASGEFLARMDADDVSVPARLEKQLAFLVAHPDVILVGSRVLLIDRSGQTLFETEQPLENAQIQHALLSGIAWVVIPASTMMRCATFRASGGYSEEYAPCEELELLVRLSEAGHLANLKDVLLHYRLYDENSDPTMSRASDKIIQRIFREAFGRQQITLGDDWKLSRRTVLPLHKQANVWAKLAMTSGDTPAARKHAFSLLKMRPLAPSSWKLMFNTIFSS